MDRDLINAIEKQEGTAYLVGGAVRDKLIGGPAPKDLDYVICGIPHDDLLSLLGKFGAAKPDAGRRFGTIKFRRSGTNTTVDIALPRKEISTGSGHYNFKVEFDHSIPIEQDLGRRDLTINAMAQHLTDKTIVDPYNGRQDIIDGIVRAVFDEAFKDDPLRMLRAAQLASRLGFKLDDKTRDQARKSSYLIKNEPAERIYDELCKGLEKSMEPSNMFRHMDKMGLLARVIPEIKRCQDVKQPNKWHGFDVYEHIMHAVDCVPSVDLVTRWAACLHDIGKPETMTNNGGVIHFYGHEYRGSEMAEEVLRRFKAPVDITRSVKTLIHNHMFEMKMEAITVKACRNIVQRVGEKLMPNLVDLRIGDRLASGKPAVTMGRTGLFRKIVHEIIYSPNRVLHVKDLTINGADLMALGVPEGKIIGEMLSKALEWVVEDPAHRNSKGKILEFLDLGEKK